MVTLRVSLLIVIGWALLPVTEFHVFAASFPESTMALLKRLNIETSELADIDRELRIPNDWLKMAEREGKLKIRGTPFTPGQTRIFLGPFRERYPFLDVDYSGGNQANRSIKTLMAYRAGRILGDSLLSAGGYILDYKHANALEDLRNIPAWTHAPPAAKEDPDGQFLGKSVSYWCMSYNTGLIKEKDIPGKWEDLVTNPIWRNGNLALANRPQLWVLNLWVAKGEAWAKKFLTRLFNEVKPQLRKEGLNIMPELASVGEFHAAIPSSPARTSRLVDAGAPVGFTCPEPVPANTATVVILKGAPNLYAARIFVNWLSSKEGQIAQYASKRFVPIHKELQQRTFIPFSDQIIGRKVAYSTPALRVTVLPKVYKFWNNLWLRGPRNR